MRVVIYILLGLSWAVLMKSLYGILSADTTRIQRGVDDKYDDDDTFTLSVGTTTERFLDDDYNTDDKVRYQQNTVASLKAQFEEETTTAATTTTDMTTTDITTDMTTTAVEDSEYSTADGRSSTTDTAERKHSVRTEYSDSNNITLTDVLMTGKTKNKLNIAQSVQNYTAIKLSAVYDKNDEMYNKTLKDALITSQTHNKQNIAQSVQNNTVNKWSIVYDKNDELYKMIDKIHTKYFVPPENEECIKRLPGAYIVGVAKSGTRELADFMHMHPGVIVRWSRSGGTPYQLRHRLFKFFKKEVAEKTILHDVPCTYSNQLVMMKADDYFASKNRAEQFKTLNPDIKIVVIVREPISRLISQMAYWFYLERKKKGEFEDIMKMLPDLNPQIRNKKGELIMSEYVKLSSYAQGLEKYLNVFPKDQIMVIEADELRYDPIGVFKNLTAFFGLTSFPSEKYFVKNPETGFYCIRSVDVENEMVCYGSNRGQTKPPSINKNTRKLLVDYFSKENEKFFKLLGRRYDWSYD